MKPIDPKRLKLGHHKIGSLVQRKFGLEIFYKVLNGLQCWDTMLLVEDNLIEDKRYSLLPHPLNPFLFYLASMDPHYDF